MRALPAIHTSEKSELIEATIQTWQPYFTKPLDEKDAEEIISRWSGFMSIVARSLDG